MVDLIGKKNEFFVIAPGFNMLVQSELSHEDFMTELSNMIKRGEVSFDAQDPNGGTTKVVMQISKEQHCSFIVMDKKGFDNWKKEQMYAQATGKGRIQ